MADNPNADVAKLTFEKALAELEQIVQKLERGDVALEESVTIYERGEVAEAPLRGTAAAGRGAGREDHARCRRQADRHRAAGCEVVRVIAS